MIDALDHELAPLSRELGVFARCQPGCRALIARLYGVGPVSATAILAELGDARRFSSSDDAVRHAGLDVTVHQSDSKRAPGQLSHQGPDVLRWALFEAALSAARVSSPDHDYYLQVTERIDHTRACISLARKLCRRAYHVLRELGDEALAPVEEAIAAAA
jgi:transposase